MENKLQNNTGVEDRNTEHRTSYKKPNGVVKFDAEGSMWYREPYGNDESAWSKFNLHVYVASDSILILYRASHLA